MEEYYITETSNAAAAATKTTITIEIPARIVVVVTNFLSLSYDAVIFREKLWVKASKFSHFYSTLCIEDTAQPGSRFAEQNLTFSDR